MCKFYLLVLFMRKFYLLVLFMCKFYLLFLLSCKFYLLFLLSNFSLVKESLSLSKYQVQILSQRLEYHIQKTPMCWLVHSLVYIVHYCVYILYILYYSILYCTVLHCIYCTILHFVLLYIVLCSLTQVDTNFSVLSFVIIMIMTMINDDNNDGSE